MGALQAQPQCLPRRQQGQIPGPVTTVEASVEAPRPVAHSSAGDEVEAMLELEDVVEAVEDGRKRERQQRRLSVNTKIEE